MLEGHATWKFINEPVIISTGVVGGPFEASGKMAHDFDLLHGDIWLKQDSFEKAQQKLVEDACEIAVKKANIQKEQVNFLITGDLINQITPSSFAAKTLGTPYLGIFSACATTAESLALSANIINNGGANYILSGTASHHSATERQYRYPTEYGGQKPPTAQWSATGAGFALVAKNGVGPVITSATIGKIIDMGMTDPYNMGGAMAPAAVDTIMQHLKDRQLDPSYYEVILTGDLGKIGREASYVLLKEKGIQLDEQCYIDCGLEIYAEDQPVQSGASGSASSAIATYGHFIKKMVQGELKRILLVATGSLHSTLSMQQKNSIPCIAHAVSIEMRSDST